MPFLRAVMRLLKLRGRGERAFFDPAFYLAVYPDIATAGVDPFHHFMQHGWREGRDPSATFRTLFYRDFHLDGADINPLAHYIESGGPASGLPTAPKSEGAFILLQRSLTAEHFDADHYRTQAGAGTLDLLGDYLTNGWKQGHSPTPDFDPARYGAEFQFTKTLRVSPLYHAVSQARLASKTSRKAKPVAISRATVETVIAPEFDRAYYLRTYSDIRDAKLDPLAHFIDHGWREGRNPTPLFDGRFYGRNNDDVDFGGVAPYYHYLTAGRAEGRPANPVGRNLYPPMRAPSEAEWTDALPAADTATAAIVVIIPVYRGYGETLRAIHAVLVAQQTVPFALHVINDATPDASIETALVQLAAKGLFSYSRHETNVGFVKSCNRALRRFADKDVVLLNADAKVCGDWLDRLAAHVTRDRRIATVTPLSNNATICSYPVINCNNLIEPDVSAETMDRLTAVSNAGRASDVPTGVGFCFYMTRESRDAVGLFDEDAFGLGYGEENDFCLRASKAGFRNVLAEDVFVYHAGEVSFAGLAPIEYAASQAALVRKHPDYETRVKRHLAADPGRLGRMRLDLYRLSLSIGRDSFVFVTHALSGGITTHVRHLEARLRTAGIRVVHIRVGVGDRWGVEIAPGTAGPYCANLQAISFHQIRPLLAEFLGWLQPRAFHIHSLVGFDWTAVKGMIGLIRDSGRPYYFTLHDYSVVCHRNHLLRTDGRYCGLPDVDTCRACVAGDRTYPEAVDPLVRRATFDAFLCDAKRVFAPSHDIAMRLQSAGAGFPIAVKPHETRDAGRRSLAPASKNEGFDRKSLDVVTIGAIGDHKGASLILDLAGDARARSLPIRFHIVGYSNASDAMLASGVNETGRYMSEAEAINQVLAIRPAMIFLPSVWPETFCYALSMAFALEIPPVVFDIGAPAARIRATDFGFVLPLHAIDDIIALNDRLLGLPTKSARKDPQKAEPSQLYPDVLKDYYGLEAEVTDLVASANKKERRLPSQ